MAEALARHYGHNAASAGTHPGTAVAANSLTVLEELGVSTDGLRPKSVDEIEGDQSIMSAPEPLVLPIDRARQRRRAAGLRPSAEARARRRNKTGFSAK